LRDSGSDGGTSPAESPTDLVFDLGSRNMHASDHDRSKPGAICDRRSGHCRGNLQFSPVMNPRSTPSQRWINDQGQAVGYSGTCTAALHAVSCENGTAFPLPDLGTGAIAQGTNNRGQIVGTVGSPDGTTQYGAFWQNHALTNLRTLPGDVAAIATGINDRGQVVGSTWDSNFNWSHGFIWQNGIMTDFNSLFPASSNLFARHG
jgi:probable HAF family extracellular repeat protein